MRTNAALLASVAPNQAVLTGHNEPTLRTESSFTLSVSQHAAKPEQQRSGVTAVVSTQRKNLLLRNFVDSLIRASGRQAEASIEVIKENPVIRVPFRFLTEVLRNGAGVSLQNLMDKKEVNKTIWLDSVRKSLENTAATIFIEPNMFTNQFARMFAGVLNMFIRFAARVALVVLNVLSPRNINLEKVPDEVLSRSLPRFIKPFSDNPIIGIVTRFLEQVVINFGLDNLFVKNHILSKFIKNQSNATSKMA